jgi:hypothetical protein
MKELWEKGSGLVWTIFETLRNLQVAQGACHSILNNSLMVIH